jgi:hypothetical protein
MAPPANDPAPARKQQRRGQADTATPNFSRCCASMPQRRQRRRADRAGELIPACRACSAWSSAELLDAKFLANIQRN